MSTSIPQASLKFLQDLAQNNHKDWMDANRATYKASEKELKKFYATVEAGLNKTDEIAKVKVFRINRDIRFSKDKTPYNVHRSVSFSRAGAHRRGGYYLRIEPGDKSVRADFLVRSRLICCESEKNLKWMLLKFEKYWPTHPSKKCTGALSTLGTR